MKTTVSFGPDRVDCRLPDKVTESSVPSDAVFTSKLTDEEAKWIMETAQSFYLNDTRYKLLER
ncbi:hypothetical protein DY000_02044493 [Brassica cretica]|uniref:Uncharacterized protein n=1 Tax=Brassica cretica TaxID=69181 RepID=A0ABQ7F956_BRACR|nr:hypothetical protein DY000_02044493 [Brassica cretica]